MHAALPPISWGFGACLPVVSGQLNPQERTPITYAARIALCCWQRVCGLLRQVLHGPSCLSSTSDAVVAAVAAGVGVAGCAPGALLLDPFRTVVPAAAYPQPSAPDVAAMSLLDAHCGSFQQVGPGGTDMVRYVQAGSKPPDSHTARGCVGKRHVCLCEASFCPEGPMRG